MKKKVLLMGASGTGKTSMRSVIFSNNPASLTGRLGVTIDVEQNHFRFLGDLILNLWDCGGQDNYMESYLHTQRATVYAHVGVLIYVFDLGVEKSSEDKQRDLRYFRESVEALQRYSPDAELFVLIHKMDLVRGELKDKHAYFSDKRDLLKKEVGDGVRMHAFGTSIYDESLYRAWSRIVHTLIPNATALSEHLSRFAEACSATEVVLFERTTFLALATSHPEFDDGQSADHVNGVNGVDGKSESDMHASRYERTSELIKKFKWACTNRLREDFQALEMKLPEFTAVLDSLTKNTYVLVIVHDPTVETAAIRMNIRLARPKFEEIQDVPTT